MPCFGAPYALWGRRTIDAPGQRTHMIVRTRTTRRTSIQCSRVCRAPRKLLPSQPPTASRGVVGDVPAFFYWNKSRHAESVPDLLPSVFLLPDAQEMDNR
jgi:hypothetical protein